MQPLTNMTAAPAKHPLEMDGAGGLNQAMRPVAIRFSTDLAQPPPTGILRSRPRLHACGGPAAATRLIGGGSLQAPAVHRGGRYGATAGPGPRSVSIAAPKTPAESPNSLRTTRVSRRSLKTQRDISSTPRP